MTAREAETLRRRRERRERQAQARLEAIVGGPLVDVGAPVIGGGDAEHLEVVRAELEERARKMQRESWLIARAFIRECWLTRPNRRRAERDFYYLMASVGMPHSVPTHSTFIEQPTITSPRTIPAL